MYVRRGKSLRVITLANQNPSPRDEFWQGSRIKRPSHTSNTRSLLPDHNPIPSAMMHICKAPDEYFFDTSHPLQQSPITVGHHAELLVQLVCMQASIGAYLAYSQRLLVLWFWPPQMILPFSLAPVAWRTVRVLNPKVLLTHGGLQNTTSPDVTEEKPKSLDSEYELRNER